MQSNRGFIQAIIVAVVALGVIAGGGVYYLSRQNRAKELYTLAQPEREIASPHEACVFVINNKQDSMEVLPIINKQYSLPPLSLISHLIEKENTPLYIACYTPHHSALWCRLHKHEQQSIINAISNELCSGYAPIEERKTEGKILHFATNDNRFLHLYIEGCVVGCSYHEKLLSEGNTSTDFRKATQTLQRHSGNGIIFHSNNDFQQGAFKMKGKTLTISGAFDHSIISDITAPFDSTVISHLADAVIQTSHTINPALNSPTTWATLKSSSDTTQHAHILIAHIADKPTVQAELYSCYTPYGYIADYNAMQQWFCKELLADTTYHLVIRRNRLYASPSYPTILQYIAELNQASHHKNIPALLPASLTVLCDSTSRLRLPHYIKTMLPQQLTEQAIAIQATDTGAHTRLYIHY